MQQSIQTLLTIFAILMAAHTAFGSDQVSSSNNDAQEQLSQKLEKFRELKTLLAKLDQEAGDQDFDGASSIKSNLDEDEETNGGKLIEYDENNEADEINKKLDEKRSGAYLRFGRSNPYLRFGRSNAAYLRFGKRLPVTGQSGSSPVFLRFGKRNPAYLRFGK